jgi:hypothetical protein
MDPNATLISDNIPEAVATIMQLLEPWEDHWATEEELSQLLVSFRDAVFTAMLALSRCTSVSEAGMTDIATLLTIPGPENDAGLEPHGIHLTVSLESLIFCVVGNKYRIEDQIFEYGVSVIDNGLMN